MYKLTGKTPKTIEESLELLNKYIEMINVQRENVKQIIIEILKNGNTEEVVLKKQYIDNLNNILSKLDNIRELIKNPTVSFQSDEFIKAIEELNDDSDSESDDDNDNI
jgi:hypothetical protein